jgi:hypothetical protein
MYAYPEPDEFDQDDQEAFEEYITQVCLHQVYRYLGGLVSFKNAVQNLEATYHEFTEDNTSWRVVFPHALNDFRSCLEAVHKMKILGFLGGDIV